MQPRFSGKEATDKDAFSTCPIDGGHFIADFAMASFTGEALYKELVLCPNSVFGCPFQGLSRAKDTPRNEASSSAEDASSADGFAGICPIDSHPFDIEDEMLTFQGETVLKKAVLCPNSKFGCSFEGDTRQVSAHNLWTHLVRAVPSPHLRRVELAANSAEESRAEDTCSAEDSSSDEHTPRAEDTVKVGDPSWANGYWSEDESSSEDTSWAKASWSEDPSSNEDE
ncbi:hypothetical protein HPB50_019195 [Hyalomma asiaticum]|uniref:Uncharacterized protein n=1 Tax=Hyalomma asiaticum TaxID=266040 RepID=A0ACB7RRN8_HYAAI|nr:hypothetical protein HPB50_019195 [Hyalomma asiaticum]